MKVGTLVRIDRLPAPHDDLNGQLGRVHRAFGVHTAYDSEDKPFKVAGYGVTMLGSGKVMVIPFMAVEIEFAPEDRGDLDQKVSWDSFAAVAGWQPPEEDLV